MAKDNRTLTKEERETVEAWLHERWGDGLKCAVCDHRAWVIGDHIVTPWIYGREGQFGMGASYPAVMLVCSNCGNTHYFNAVVMGLVHAVQYCRKSRRAGAAPMPEEKSKISTESASGRLSVVHTERSMNCYNVSEPELESLTLLNVASAAGFAIGGAVLGFCFDFKKDVLFAENLSPDARVLDFTVNWLGFPVALIAFAIAGLAWWQRGNIIAKIKSESRVVSSA